jgi:hypothetical protein
VTDQQTTDATDPREGPHDGPAVAVASQPPPIFTRTRGAVGAIANNEDYPPSSEPLSHGVTLVAAVADRAVGIATRLPTSDARHPNPVQRRLDQRDFRRRGRGEMYFRRSTLLNVGASSFALAKDPSMNVLSRRRRPRASTGPRKSRHTRSHVPSSSHARSRRQHVVPLGFPSDRLRHRAPVLSTQRIPATTSRCGTRGRPPRCERVSRGRRGSMVARCASVNRKLR